MTTVCASRRFVAVLSCATSLAVSLAFLRPDDASASASSGVQERTAPAPRPADAEALKDFEKRVKDYEDLQKTLASKVTRPPTEATPQEVDKYERALAALIENARRTARQGDIFTPAIQAIARRELGRIFGGPQGKQLIASVMDENPVKATLKINARYPDEVPMSTMPPEVLAVLPPLPKTLNYRFISDQLILLDTEAHIVVDFISKALPIVP
jgi:hypothetical protein